MISAEATITVIGVGRVGLPLALLLAERGARVFGVDSDVEHVSRLADGRMPFLDPGVGVLLTKGLESGNFIPTTDTSTAVSQSSAVIVTVGTPLGGDLKADTTQIVAALEEIGPWLRRGVVVILRSTVSPGTTERTVVPTLERLTGRSVGPELSVAFCPERIAEGRSLAELGSLPEIVGGVDELSCERAGGVLAMLAEGKKIHQTDPTSAELAKLFGNTYRYVNFALANEYALIAEHYRRDAHAIISMVRDSYPRAPIPSPGPAGGPCLSKDGYFLIEELTFPDFVLTAWKLNDSVPAHLVERLDVALQRSGRSVARATVAVLGTAFKADIDDDRQSPSLRLISRLSALGAEVRVHDPYLAPGDLSQLLAGADAVVLATNHDEYVSLAAAEVLEGMKPSPVVVDAWGVWKREEWELEGATLITFGRG